MVLVKAFEPPDLLVATLSGVVTSSDQADFVEWVRATIHTAGSVRLLILLEQFGGWHFESLEDGRLWLRDDEGVSKMALVGSPERRLAVLTALGQPVRQMPIEYFESQTEARRWLMAADAEAWRDVRSSSRGVGGSH
jgi:hypothetical protein